jgi:hypothetical protein
MHLDRDCQLLKVQVGQDHLLDDVTAIWLAAETVSEVTEGAAIRPT